MARYIVDAEVKELEELGVSYAELDVRIGGLYLDADHVYAWGRAGQGAVRNILFEARDRTEAAARRREREQQLGELRQGRRIEWRRIGGAWLIVGTGLTTGEIVDVFRQDGTRTEEVVGRIVTVKDGLTDAYPGTL